MKSFFSLSLLSSKFTLLACFSLMSFVMSPEVSAAPCHEEINSVQEMDMADCNACEIAEKSWSEQFVANQTDIQFESIAQVVTAPTDYLSSEISFVQNLNTPDPPIYKAVLHPHLIAQKTIVLVI